MNAIILAGGAGSRMEEDLPKALVEVRGKPILAYQLDYLKDKTDKIILAIGIKSDMIIDYVSKNYPDRNIIFSVEGKKLGTGGAIKQAMGMADSEKVLVLNCDDLTNIDIEKLKSQEENTVCVAHPQLPFGLVRESDEGYAVFVEKPTLPDWVSCGWYLFKKAEIYDLLPDEGNIEAETFPKIKLRLFKHEGIWQTFNTKKDIQEFESKGQDIM